MELAGDYQNFAVLARQKTPAGPSPRDRGRSRSISDLLISCGSKTALPIGKFRIIGIKFITTGLMDF